jgi:hypothetical protein
MLLHAYSRWPSSRDAAPAVPYSEVNSVPTDTDPPTALCCWPMRARCACALGPIAIVQCFSSWRWTTACSGRATTCGPAEPSRCPWCGSLESTMQVCRAGRCCACSWQQHLWGLSLLCGLFVCPCGSSHKGSSTDARCTALAQWHAHKMRHR